MTSSVASQAASKGTRGRASGADFVPRFCAEQGLSRYSFGPVIAATEASLLRFGVVAGGAQFARLVAIKQTTQPVWSMQAQAYGSLQTRQSSSCAERAQRCSVTRCIAEQPSASRTSSRAINVRMLRSRRWNTWLAVKLGSANSCARSSVRFAVDPGHARHARACERR